MQGNGACLQIYPAMLALAKSMNGSAQFARLVADTDEQTQAITSLLGVDVAPTFIFFEKVCLQHSRCMKVMAQDRLKNQRVGP